MKENYESLEELIEILDEIRREGEGTLSCPKALYLLSSEIKKVKEMLNGILAEKVGF